MIKRIRKWGGSHGILFSKEDAELFDLKEGDVVKIDLEKQIDWTILKNRMANQYKGEPSPQNEGDASNIMKSSECKTCGHSFAYHQNLTGFTQHCSVPHCTCLKYLEMIKVKEEVRLTNQSER